MRHQVRNATLIAIGMVLCVFVCHVHAQSTLDVLGHKVALGAERKAMLAELKGFRLQCIGEPASEITHCNSLLVQGPSPPYDAYANIYFQQDRIKSVRKYWSRGYEGSDPGPFARTLFAVVAQMSSETGIAPTITTSARRDPGVLQQTILISSGKRSVEIYYAEGLRGVDGNILAPFVNITEKLE